MQTLQCAQLLQESQFFQQETVVKCRPSLCFVVYITLSRKAKQGQAVVRVTHFTDRRQSVQEAHCQSFEMNNCPWNFNVCVFLGWRGDSWQVSYKCKRAAEALLDSYTACSRTCVYCCILCFVPNVPACWHFVFLAQKLFAAELTQRRGACAKLCELMWCSWKAKVFRVSLKPSNYTKHSCMSAKEMAAHIFFVRFFLSLRWMH